LPERSNRNVLDRQFAAMQAENSDVVPLPSVDVAVIILPVARPGTETANTTLPEPSVVTIVDPRKTAPSPFPLGALQAELEKNSIVNVAMVAGPFNVPLTVPPDTWADEMTG